MGVGFGVFTESKEAVVLKDNLLINMGESYIVTNLQQNKLKMRVFSVVKADSPDLYSCQHTD